MMVFNLCPTDLVAAFGPGDSSPTLEHILLVSVLLLIYCLLLWLHLSFLGQLPHSYPALHVGLCQDCALWSIALYGCHLWGHS